MSNKYGYVGKDVPTQSFGSNKGVLNTDDLYELSNAGKLTQYGQLELIETQTGSAVTSILFDDIKEDIYNVHFMTMTNYSGTVLNTEARIRFYESGIEESGNVYQFAYLYPESGGGVGESRTTTISHLRAGYSLGVGSNRVSNSYQYFYNLGDSTKYSFQTMQVTGMSTDASTYRTVFGSGVLPQTSTVDKIKLYYDGGGTFDSTVSLYGIRYS
jgi:hypothetical protein